MIDEKLLIEDIWKQSNNHTTEWSTGGILALIEKQPKADWIPCTVVDHPEHCNNCEVTIKDTIGYFRDIAYYTDKWRRLADEMPVNVIAWKEPSRPYKKEGAE